MRKSALVFCLFAVSAALRADVTIKYDMQITTSPIIPAQALQQLSGPLAQGVTAQFKDGKGRTTFAGTTSLIDYSTQEFTLIDDANKRYTTVSLKDIGNLLTSALPAIPDQAKQMLAGIKFDVAPGATKTATVLGMTAEAKETNVTMNIPIPAGVAAPPQGMPSLGFKIAIYSVGQTQAAITPGLWEYAGYLAVANQASLGMVRQILTILPGLGDALGPMFAEMADPSKVMVKFDMEMGAGMLGPDPLMKMSQSMTQISSAPVDAALFQVPAGYTKTDASAFVDRFKALAGQAGAAPATAR